MIDFFLKREQRNNGRYNNKKEKEKLIKGKELGHN